MAIKDILVHVDVSSSCRARLNLAGQLAARFGAHLLGVGSDAGNAAEERFDALLSSLGLSGRWHLVEGLLAPAVSELAVAADLVILGQPDPDRLLVELNTPEDVIFACARPVLMVPYAGDFTNVGERTLVAWNGSREATRAVHDAIPLVLPATQMIVASVDLSTVEQIDRGGLVEHLDRHGLSAVAEDIGARDREIADLVNLRAAEFGCDLIVMGAYSHSRLRETVLGGTTRDMVNTMRRPVLMAH